MLSFTSLKIPFVTLLTNLCGVFFYVPLCVPLNIILGYPWLYLICQHTFVLIAVAAVRTNTKWPKMASITY